MSRRALAIVPLGLAGASILGLRLPVSPIALIARDRLELDSLEADLIEVAIRTMQPAHASLWPYRPKMEETTAIPDDGTKTLSQSVP